MPWRCAHIAFACRVSSAQTDLLCKVRSWIALHARNGGIDWGLHIGRSCGARGPAAEEAQAVWSAYVTGCSWLHWNMQHRLLLPCSAGRASHCFTPWLSPSSLCSPSWRHHLPLQLVLPPLLLLSAAVLLLSAAVLLLPLLLLLRHRCRCRRRPASLLRCRPSSWTRPPPSPAGCTLACMQACPHALSFTPCSASRGEALGPSGRMGFWAEVTQGRAGTLAGGAAHQQNFKDTAAVTPSCSLPRTGSRCTAGRPLSWPASWGWGRSAATARQQPQQHVSYRVTGWPDQEQQWQACTPYCMHALAQASCFVW